MISMKRLSNVFTLENPLKQHFAFNKRSLLRVFLFKKLVVAERGGTHDSN